MLSISPAGSILVPGPTTNSSASPGIPTSNVSTGLPVNYLPPSTIYTPPPNYSCTPGYCIQQLQALLNMLITATLAPGYSFPLVVVDGNVRQDTINAILYLNNTGIPQFALLDAKVDANWVTANSPSLVQSYAAYLNVDPSSLLPPAPVLPPSPVPPTYVPPTMAVCPDGTAVSDISLCPPPTGGTTVTVRPPIDIPPSLLPDTANWWQGLVHLATDYWYVPAGLALLGGVLLFSRRKRA